MATWRLTFSLEQEPAVSILESGPWEQGQPTRTDYWNWGNDPTLSERGPANACMLIPAMLSSYIWIETGMLIPAAS